MRLPYRIEATIGQGGTGMVYRGTDGRRTVAIKELNPPIADPRYRKAFAKQFEQEAAILKSLDHAALPVVYDYFAEEDKAYLVMEFIPGHTLDREKVPCPELLALRWGIDIAQLLDYLHSHHVIFRDLKPNNLMRQPDGQIRLLDFGIAKLFDPAVGAGTPAVVRGAYSPGFAAPEQYLGQPTDARTDIYALGATLYFLLTGVTPPQSIHLHMGEQKLQPITELNSRVSRGLAGVVEKMLKLQPEDRLQTAAEAVAALQAIQPRGCLWHLWERHQ